MYFAHHLLLNPLKNPINILKRKSKLITFSVKLRTFLHPLN